VGCNCRTRVPYLELYSVAVLEDIVVMGVVICTQYNSRLETRIIVLMN